MRTIQISLAIMAGLLIAGSAPAEPTQPSWAPLDAAAIEAARLRAAETMGTDPRLWEAQVPEPGTPEGDRGGGLRADIYWPDSHASHYARGQTYVIHVFVNSTGATWTAPERSAAGADAAVARDYYTGNAPAAADLHFDGDAVGYNYMVTSVPYAVPYDGFTWDMVEDALSAAGYTDADGDGYIRDDFSISLQNYAGGWDNVLACIEPHVDGRSYAGQNTSTTILYMNADGSVFAHEWGHLFGECDEYVENGHCQGGVDCGPCRSTYLSEIVDNGNCDLPACPSDVACLMRDNTFTNICDYTLKHWAWWDTDANGILDQVNRKVAATSFVPIVEMLDGWTRISIETEAGWVFAQREESWAVAAVSAPATVDYDLTLYGDNNHNYAYASSAQGVGVIDFVVGDYNHSRVGLDHLQVNRYSGDQSNYMLQYREGGDLLYSDGIARSGSFVTGGIVLVYDVPLFGGENVPFTLSVTGGNLDLGMSLFKSNGGYYWAGRSAAQWTRDAAGPGGTETASYTVPSDDVYGLVIFSKTATTGSFTIQVGGTSVTLAEEVPVQSTADLQNYNYDPNAFSWSIVGVRPHADTEVKLSLYDFVGPGGELETSNGSGTGRVEFVAADYTDGYNRDYVRVTRESGTGAHTTEWEQDDDNLQPVTPILTWITNHVAKIWDVNLTEGRSYFFREYQDPYCDLDSGIYLFSSADGDRFKNRHAFLAAGDNRPPSAGGEWFSVTAPATDTYGFCQIANNSGTGQYSIWFGRQKALADRERFSVSEPILFASANVGTGNWAAFAARPIRESDEVGMWLFGDDGYSDTSVLAGDESGNSILYVVGDYNHNPAGAVYPRAHKVVGSYPVDVQYESGTETLTFQPGQIATQDNIFFHDDVVVICDVFIDGGMLGRDVYFEVRDLGGEMDLGLALFKSAGGAYYAGPSDAVESSDRHGVGGTESFTYEAIRADWYGLVVYKKNPTGSGLFRISVADPAVVDVAEQTPPRFDFSLRSANPVMGDCVLGYALRAPGPVGLTIYDVQGRLVRSLLSGSAAAGADEVRWDGRDDAGNQVSTGVYVASLRTRGEDKRIKLVRVR